jgi:hypothetical protein
MAQYLLAARALLATAARGVEPGHPDAGSRLRPSDAFVDLLDHACGLTAGTSGNWTSGKALCRTAKSLWQTPQAWTQIRTRPGPGEGFSRSSTATSPFCSYMTTAFIA